MSSGAAFAYSSHDIEILVLIKDTRVQELIFRITAVRERFASRAHGRELWPADIVKELHENGRGIVEVVIEFLHILSVVAFLLSDRRAVLQDRVPAIPECKCKTKF